MRSPKYRNSLILITFLKSSEHLSNMLNFNHMAIANLFSPQNFFSSECFIKFANRNGYFSFFKIRKSPVTKWVTTSTTAPAPCAMV